MGTDRLPELIDQKGLRDEMKIPDSLVRYLFRNIEVIQLPGYRKPMIRCADVLALLSEHSYGPSDVVNH